MKNGKSGTDEDVLREAVRLAELRIEELSQTIRILEHKAIALVTLCFAVMDIFILLKNGHVIFLNC